MCDDPATLASLVPGCDAVINLVGIFAGVRGDPYGSAFAQAHVELPKRTIAACVRDAVCRARALERAQGRRRMRRASTCAPRRDGEAAVVAVRGALRTTIFRPSVVFGPEDRFLNLFAELQRLLPVLLLGSPEAKLPAGVCRRCARRRSSQASPRPRPKAGLTISRARGCTRCASSSSTPGGSRAIRGP